MRLFAAVWPPQDVLDHLDLALASARGGPAGASTAVRWSARETWHLTAAFYGTVADGAVTGLVDALRAELSGRATYDLALRGAGVFAHRTLWVGVGGDVDAQRSVSAACARAGLAVGAEPDARPRERPHLTIGRVRPGPRPPRRRGSRPDGARSGTTGPREAWPADPGDEAAGLAHALAVYSGPAWTVHEVQLVESRPGAGRGGGPLYTTVETVALLASH